MKQVKFIAPLSVWHTSVQKHTRCKTTFCNKCHSKD